MGNVECCQQKYDPSEVDSKEELYIRETIRYFSKKMVDNVQLFKLMQECFSIILLDIDGPPLDWISLKSYNDFINRIFDKDKTNKKEEKEIKFIKLEYNNVKCITLKDYDDKFHLLLCIWLIGISPPRTINDEDKVRMIKSIIIKCNKYITYKTFSKFLNTFLEMMLIEITSNFQRHNLQDTKVLLNDVYNIKNVNEYCKWLCWKMGKIITKNKKVVFSDVKAINNEFIKDEHLETFFKKYSFLLRPIELRNNFYKKYNIDK